MAKRRKNKHKQPAPSTPAKQTPVQSSVSRSKPVTSGDTLQSIEQQRAKHALAAVKRWETKEASDQKELKAYVVGMPAMILMSGFGQTCAFYKANKKDNHAIVLNVLENWLDEGDLMAFITQSSAQDYQLAQAESLAYLNWLKKFVRAYLQGEDDVAAS